MCGLDLGLRPSASAAKWAEDPTTPVDTTISTREHEALEGSAPEDLASACAEDRPEFWLDMCEGGGHGAGASAAAEHVNLQLNPEGWTGYNGSHVWEAIYHENCLRGVSDPDDMCYEERVLYRLLSGMHASVNVHVALKAKPPRRNTPGREVWSRADPKRFQRMYGEHPERLRTCTSPSWCCCARRGKPRRRWRARTWRRPRRRRGRARTAALLRRLLDTHILSSCSGVFGAFDESALFRAVAEEMKAGRDPETSRQESVGTAAWAGGAGAPASRTLKAQFKGVFHNISDVMDCVSCQKCKLHGKLQLLGLGTALKVLLLPEDMHAAALSRAEIVALVNTVAKFSRAIARGARTHRRRLGRGTRSRSRRGRLDERDEPLAAKARTDAKDAKESPETPATKKAEARGRPPPRAALGTPATKKAEEKEKRQNPRALFTTDGLAETPETPGTAFAAPGPAEAGARRTRTRRRPSSSDNALRARPRRSRRGAG